MTYIPNPDVTIRDSANLDAFSRLRVSNPTTLFHAQHQYKALDLWWDSDTTGSGSIAHNANEASADLTVTTASGDEAIYQSLKYFRYQPGKSQQILLTFVFPTQDANRRVRIGQFNDDNGIFLEDSGSAIRLIRRTKTSGSVVDNAVAQASWNIDVMDGTGPSGKTLDLTKTNILLIDYQWLGVGRVRVGFEIDGVVYYVHEFLNANVLTVPYTQTMNLPIRAEVTNTGVASAGAHLAFICASIISEGGVAKDLGYPLSTSSGTTGTAIPSGTITPVISIRCAINFNSIASNQIEVLLKTVELLNDGLNPAYCQLIYNGSLTGASFAAVDATNSSMEVDVAASAISGGIPIHQFYVPGGILNTESHEQEILSRLPLVNKLDGTQIPLTLAAAGVGGPANNCYGVFEWVEIR